MQKDQKATKEELEKSGFKFLFNHENLEVWKEKAKTDCECVCVDPNSRIIKEVFSYKKNERVQI